MSVKLIILFITTSAFAKTISIKAKDEASKKTARVFVDQTLKLVPSSILKVLDKKTISVEFKDLNPTKVELPNPCEEGSNFKYGNYNLGKITLDERFLEVIKENKNSIDFNCKHKSYLNLAKAALLHEIAHSYDNKFLWSKRASNDLELRSLGFWDTESHLNKNYNTFHKRSPDEYEYEKRKEYFAVNFEYFILDPEYKCRRPELYNYYKKELNFAPNENSDCQTDDVISFTSDNGIKSQAINAKLIKEVHFLFAAEGPQMMSKWGHSMFKLIVCKTEEDTLEECRANSKDHIVISFLAYVDELSIGALKGVFGKYPSRMLVSDLGAIKRQYTRGEFRSLKSLPLKFEDSERQRFLNQLLRVYWEYAGRYYFFTNNCADEAFKLVQAALNTKKAYKKDITTPLGLYKHLVKSNLADESVLNDINEATKLGFFYPSFGDGLTKIYETLKKNFENIYLPEKFEDYAKLHPTDRRFYLEKMIETYSAKTQLYSLMTIEGHGQYLDGQAVLSAMTDFKTIDSLSDEYKKMLEETVELKNTYLYGQSTQEIGYGIPTLNERVIDEDNLELRNESDVKRDKILLTIREEIKKMNSKHFERYEMAQENITLIKKAILKK